MDVYSIIKWYHSIKSPRLKLLGILGLHLLHRRYLYIAMDPALACNLRCRMCYFSDPQTVKDMSGHFTDDDIEAIARTVFHRGLKLQIGCGAEPTTFKALAALVKTAKEHGIPNISITTNGNLLTLESLRQLVENGLDELILSTHGLTEDVYESLMVRASFERFQQLLGHVATVRKDHPQLRFRINYTMCSDNMDDLKHFPEVFRNAKPDVIQLRPVQDIGSEAYDNYSVDPILGKYKECVEPIVDYCAANKITCLYPKGDNLSVIDHDNKKMVHLNSVVDMLPYFHLSPFRGWKEEFNPYTETFEQFARRTHRVRNILRMLFGWHPASVNNREDTTRALNYKVQ